MNTLFHLQRTTMTERRKQLRNNSTLQEKLLWKHLQGSRTGFKFIRQYSVDNYVVDFYCPAKRLAIELDGGVHFSASQQKYDKYRTNILKHSALKFSDLKIRK